MEGVRKDEEDIMSFLNLRRVMGLSVIFAVLLGVIPAFAQTGGLTGAAKGEKGEPLVGHPIIIERQDVKGTYPTKTNKKGEYIYIGLPLGNYKVTLQDPGGRVLFYQTLRVGMGDPTVLDFDLAKERVRSAEDQQKALAANPVSFTGRYLREALGVRTPRKRAAARGVSQIEWG